MHFTLIFCDFYLLIVLINEFKTHSYDYCDSKYEDLLVISEYISIVM